MEFHPKSRIGFSLNAMRGAIRLIAAPFYAINALNELDAPGTGTSTFTRHPIQGRPLWSCSFWPGRILSAFRSEEIGLHPGEHRESVGR
jgi:hypothetical protein